MNMEISTSSNEFDMPISGGDLLRIMGSHNPMFVDGSEKLIFSSAITSAYLAHVGRAALKSEEASSLSEFSSFAAERFKEALEEFRHKLESIDP